MSESKPLSSAREDRDRLVADLHTHGYCVVADALDATLLARVHERLADQAAAEWQRAIRHGNPAHLDPGNQWVNMLLNKGDVFQQLVLDPPTGTLVEHLLGPDYLLSACDAQIKHPGAHAMPLHSDQWWLPKPVQPGEPFERVGAIRRNQGSSTVPTRACDPINPPVVAVVMWMISDFTEANGATRLVPGSHLTGAEPDASVPHRAETVAAVGTAGTALVFDGRTWHGAGANRTDAIRFAITCGFVAPQFRALECYPRALRPEVLETASSALLDLIGFRAWEIYGHAGDPAAPRLVDGREAIGVLHAETAAPTPRP